MFQILKVTVFLINHEIDLLCLIRSGKEFVHRTKNPSTKRFPYAWVLTLRTNKKNYNFSV